MPIRIGKGATRTKGSKRSETRNYVPNPDKNLIIPMLDELIAKNGIYNHENLDFTDVLKDRVYEFVYVFSPLRIKGATGSPGRPIAIV